MAKKRPLPAKEAAKARAKARELAAGAFDGIGHKEKRAFLMAFAAYGRVFTAADAVGVSRSIHYVWLKDPEYADAFKLAEDIAGDVLEAEAVRRAVEGIEEPVVYQGAMIGHWRLPDGSRLPGNSQEEPPAKGADFVPLTVNKRSDNLLRLLLEGFKGSKYATQRHQVAGPGGGPVPLSGHGVLLVPARASDMEEWLREHGPEAAPQPDDEL